MKKIFTTLFAGLMISAQVLAASAKDVCGQFTGTLMIDWTPFENRSVYLLPGAEENTLTFVLPDFSWGNGKLGNIVLPNITIDEEGKLSLDSTSLYLDSISLRASIKMLNNYFDDVDQITYHSTVAAGNAEVTLEISEPKTLPVPIIVIFQGKSVSANNYALTNGGFEGDWTNNEPAGWHSFGTAAGSLKNMVTANTDQFIQSGDVRPGSKGNHSALVSSKMVLGNVIANGNCTNGQINAGSTTADDPNNNFNFSDPSNEGFNTPFQGHPDSLVFWAKYVPADRDVANEVNKARASVIITTNDRYQDPEGDKDYSSVVLAKAVVNYAATSDMGWQRISVPFEYTAAALENAPAYILSTFTTNMVPGGGSSYREGRTNILDSLYLDDVELVYNRELASFSRDNAELSFDKNIASVDANYCDSCAKYATEDNGISAQTFIAMDAAHKCIFVYVIADDYAQSGKYNLYRVDFTDSETEGLGPKEDETEGFESILSGEKRFKKVLFNGQFLIISNDAWYNAAGVRVR